MQGVSIWCVGEAVNGADLFVRCLMDRGVQVVTTLSGNGMDPFYEACRNAGLRLVDFRNEQAAAFAADAAARLDKRLAVCAVNATVGNANAIVGFVNAAFAGSPMLLLTGAAPHAQADRRPVPGYRSHAASPRRSASTRGPWIDAERIPFYVHEACSRAVSGRPGPVHLTIPADILNTKVEPTLVGPPPAPSGAVRPLAAPDPHLLREAATLLAQAKRPVIVAGSGGYFAGAEDVLNAFAAKMKIPVVVPIWDQGTIPAPADHFVGIHWRRLRRPAPAARCRPPLPRRRADRLPHRVSASRPGWRPMCGSIRIDIDPEEIVQGRSRRRHPGGSRLRADRAARRVRRQGSRPHSVWLAEARRRWEQFRSPWTGGPPPPIHP